MMSPISANIASASDIELIIAISQDRSQRALEDLYRRYRPLLRTVISRILSTDTDCDDVLQDVLVQVWEQAPSYSPDKGQPVGWLITIARRRALDRVRKMCSYKNATERYERTFEGAPPYAGEMFIVDHQVHQNELNLQIRTQLEKLPEAQREAVNLTFFHGLTQREIAARLSVPLGTIKTRIELGMQKLGRAFVFEQAA